MGATWRSDKDTDEQRGLWTMEGGVDTLRHPQFLEANKTSMEDGVMVVSPVAIRNRRLKSPAGSVASSTPQALFGFEGVLMRIVSGTVQRWDGSSWINVLTGLNATAIVEITPFEISGSRAIILTNGTDNVKYIKVDWTTGDVNAANAPKGKYIMNDTVRVYIAKGDILYFCARLTVTDWTTANNSGFIQVYTSNGGDITGLVRFLGSRLIFKKDYMGDLHGNNLKEFEIVDISTQVGCLSSASIVEVNGTLFWLGYKQVYAFSGGIPTPVGEPIRYWLDRIDWFNPQYCFGYTDGENYFLGVNDASRPTDFAETILCYNTKNKVWRVNRTGEANSFGTFIYPSAWTMTSSGTVYFESTSTLTPTTGATMTLTSAAFTEGSPEVWKEYYELHVQAKLLTVGTTIQVYVSTTAEGENFQLIDTISYTNGSTVDSAHIVPLDTVPLCHWFRIRLVIIGDAEVYSAERFFNLLPADH